MLEAELVTDVERLAALTPEWDALAVAAQLPQMCPAWVLAWWRHIAPAAATPRTVLARLRRDAGEQRNRHHPQRKCA